MTLKIYRPAQLDGDGDGSLIRGAGGVRRRRRAAPPGFRPGSCPRRPRRCPGRRPRRPDAEEAADSRGAAARPRSTGRRRSSSSPSTPTRILRRLLGAPVWGELTDRQKEMLSATARDHFARALAAPPSTASEVAWAALPAGRGVRPRRPGPAVRDERTQDPLGGPPHAAGLGSRGRRPRRSGTLARRRGRPASWVPSR